jgi:gamma-glutamylcyclotransferase (GGCT)/AIG2-like uncharacterized protein YtfP
MCLIIYKKESDIIVPEALIDQTAAENRDGFGVTYLDTLQTYRTLDYGKAEKLLKVERPLIAHYRYATRGEVAKTTCHPFKFSKGWLYSNGTVDGLGSQKVCDTQEVAHLLDSTPKKYWANLLAMTSTRFAIVEKSGKVSLYGSWVEKDGVWYSKDVSVRKVSYFPVHTPSKHTRKIGYNYADTYADGYADNYKTSNYWEREQVAARQQDAAEGRELLDSWLKSREEAEKEVEEVAEYDGFCAELATLGYDYDTGFGVWLEDPNTGSIVEIASGCDIPDSYAAGVSWGVLEFLLGEDDPFSRAEDIGGDAEVCEPFSWGGNHLVAVYGTLKHGRGNHGVLWKGGVLPKFMGQGTTVEKLRMEVCGVPFVYPGDSPEGHNIVVEVYMLTCPEARRATDRLEGHPNFYTRRETEIKLNSGKCVTAWMYYIEDVPDVFTSKFVREF